MHVSSNDLDASELEDSGVQIERVFRETVQSSAADSMRIQFSIGRSCEQDGGMEDSFLDPEFFSNLLLSFVYAVRSKHGGILAEEKTRFSNLVVHRAKGSRRKHLSCSLLNFRVRTDGND